MNACIDTPSVYSCGIDDDMFEMIMNPLPVYGTAV